MNKYRNNETTYYGIKFKSAKEADYYLFLLSEENAGRIKTLKLQVPFLLLEAGENKYGMKYRKMEYIADFAYYDIKKDHVVVEDTKGFRTDVYKLKKKLFLSRYPDIEFNEV